MIAECGFGDDGEIAGADALELNGPTLTVQIGFDPAYRKAHDGHPKLPRTKYPALVDTGASQSCIDSMLAAELQLPVVDTRPVSGVHGSQNLDVHMAQIRVPSLDITILGQFTGVKLSKGGQGTRALIGRTFLRRFRLVYDGPSGRVTLERDPYALPQHNDPDYWEAP